MRDDVPPPLPAAMPAPGDASDSALAMRLASGERPALGLIYQRHKGLVYRFALLWTGSAPAAADVTQDVFVHLLTHANDFDATRGALPAWLLGIAHNFARRRTPCVEEASALDDVADDVPALDVQLHDRRSVDALRRAIALLPPHYRDVLVLVELSERSYAETAVICGCPLNTIRSRLARARALLARELGIGDDKPALPAASWTPREAGPAPIGPIGSHDEH